MNGSISRRRFLAGSLGAATALAGPLAALGGAQTPIARGRFIRTLPLGDPTRPDHPPLNRLLGAGLDARLFTDLSAVGPGALITPNDRFYIRTACPDEAVSTRRWTIALGGTSRGERVVALDTLDRRIEPMGACLLECAGNTNANNFGLMSAARWDGLPVGALLDRLPAPSGNYRVKITGVDDERHLSRTSTPGASWIFPRGELERAFLATHMNGAPLPPHHGAPVRLVVPGWYGCACIKWVNRVDLVADDEPPTSQMVEFASRTHQPEGAVLARDYEPAVIDLAAAPIRVEQWIVDERPVYRIVGVMWGGRTATNALQIRVRSGGAWMDVSDCPRPAATLTWSVWSHRWRPEAPGRYEIVLRVNDPTIRTRRLDRFFYARSVDVSEV
jgi:DMSO/TMAO reductase YedYZ molybdopterin-dependent catalytic subunit